MFPQTLPLSGSKQLLALANSTGVMLLTLHGENTYKRIR
jgi:hypothetical protein